MEAKHLKTFDTFLICKIRNWGILNLEYLSIFFILTQEILLYGKKNNNKKNKRPTTFSNFVPSVAATK